MCPSPLYIFNTRILCSSVPLFLCSSALLLLCSSALLLLNLLYFSVPLLPYFAASLLLCPLTSLLLCSSALLRFCSYAPPLCLVVSQFLCSSTPLLSCPAPSLPGCLPPGMMMEETGRWSREESPYQPLVWSSGREGLARQATARAPATVGNCFIVCTLNCVHCTGLHCTGFDIAR